MFKTLFGITFFAAIAAGGTFFPLQMGNTWIYREAGTGQSFTVTVGTPVLMNGRVYHPIRGYTAARLLARMDEQNNLVQVNEETGAEQVITSFTPFEGGWWQAPSRECDQEGQTLSRRGVFDGAAGPFQDVLQIRYRAFSCADAGEELEQYAENIGMVRRVSQSFAGPKQLDLVYARVGHVQINAAPNAQFSVSMQMTRNSPTLEATLRLRVNSPLPVKLNFPSSQEFEVLLRDETGKVIWKWSDGQMFAQVLHEKQVAVEWTIPVPIPRPVASGGPQPGNYTLQAWLATADANPQFAATVPVTITPDAPR
ncbi:MAG: hypothetical protein IT167_22310 [Bryobacterales bacterium]|nr:hypothetical protein [Bryobacterales bacterium]